MKYLVAVLLFGGTLMAACCDLPCCQVGGACC